MIYAAYASAGDTVMLDSYTSVTVADTRIKVIHATGNGTFIIDGTSVDDRGTKKGNIIKFFVPAAASASDIVAPDPGIKMDGNVSITIPAGGTLTVFYG